MVRKPDNTLLCEPHDGSRGISFTRSWLPMFMMHLVGIIDDSGESLASNVEGTDEGSPNNPIPDINEEVAGPQAQARHLKKHSLYKARCSKAFAAFYTHITDIGFRERLQTFAQEQAALGINARNGPVALRIANEWFASPMNALTLQALNVEWNNLSIVQLGVDKNSLNRLYTRLMTLNKERPDAQKYDADAIAIKFLSCITFPEPLFTRALSEMNDPTIGIDEIVDLVRLKRIVEYFQNLWETYCDKGLIKNAPAKINPSANSGQRVDGFELEQSDQSYSNACVTFREEDRSGEPDANDDDFVYEVKFTSGPRKGEIICYNCLGAGHTSRNCASKKVHRNKQDHIRRLAQGGGDITITRARRMPPRPPSTGPRSRFATDKSSNYSVKMIEAADEIDERETESQPDQMPEDEERSSIESQLMAFDADSFCLECEPVEDTLSIKPDAQALFQQTIQQVNEQNANETHANIAQPQSTHAYVKSCIKSIFSIRLQIPAPFVILCILLASMQLGGSTTAHHETAFALNKMQTHDEHSSFQVCPDTGASQTASPKRKLFPDEGITDYKPNRQVRTASGALLKVEFVGTLLLKVQTPDSTSAKKFFVLPVKQAMYVPGLHSTLLSARALFENQSVQSHFNSDPHLLLPNGIRIPFEDTGRAYTLRACDIDATQVTKDMLTKIDLLCKQSKQLRPVDSNSVQFCLPGTRTRDLMHAKLDALHAMPHYSDLVHARLLHPSYTRLLASRQYVDGIDFEKLMPTDCPACKRANIRRPPVFQSSSKVYERFAERICSDACSMPPSTPFGFTGVVDFYDSATKYVAFYFLRTDSAEEMRRCFDEFLIDHKKYMPHGRVLEWFFDNHGQFTSGDTAEAMRALKTKLRSIVPWNPQQNPAERPWASMLPALRKALAASNLSENTWPFLLKQWERVSNGLVTTSKSATSLGASPYYMVTCGKKSDMSLLRVIGCRVDCIVRSAHDRNQHLSKLSPRVSGVHLGIDTHKSGYLVYVPDWERLQVFRFGDCEFYENEFPHVQLISGTLLIPDRTPIILPSIAQQRALIKSAAAELPRNHFTTHHAIQMISADDSIVCAHSSDSVKVRPVSGFEDTHIDEIIFSLSQLMQSTKLPKTFHQADALPPDEARLWREAGQKEFTAKMATNRAAVLVDRPPASVNVLPSKVVFTHKKNSDGSIAEYKCRWTACGN